MSKLIARAARAVGIASVAAALALAGCASTPSSQPSSSAGGGAPASLTLQLRFTNSVQFAGSYVADSKGYYKDQNLTVKIVPGGPSVDIGTVIAQGTADIGISTVKQVSQANAQGADLRIIAAGYQHSASMIISMPNKPIKTPADLKGKKIGVIAVNVAAVTALLQANGMSKNDVQIVTIQGDPSPMLSGQVDAIYTVYPTGYEQMKSQGIEPVMLRTKDFGFDNLDLVYAVTARTLQDPVKRDAIQRFLVAEIKGWQQALDDPDLAAQLSVNTYGKDLGLDLKGQTAQANDQKTLFQVDAGSPGIFWMPQSGIDASIAAMKLYGVDAKASYFDTSLLKEIYHRG